MGTSEVVSGMTIVGVCVSPMVGGEDAKACRPVGRGRYQSVVNLEVKLVIIHVRHRQLFSGERSSRTATMKVFGPRQHTLHWLPEVAQCDKPKAGTRLGPVDLMAGDRGSFQPSATDLV